MVPQLEMPAGGEWLVILVVVVLLFGANKLPELARGAAQALKEFKKVQNGDDEQNPAVEAAPKSESRH
ncbi:twin-arginine translocase TatA/TatE family subunit [Kribbella sp. NPDC056345]|uniref:twin-arginine translocase TatA/TatE family subunit n=1 Tax=Kribbella sp. NPDC056345 TaxID=3345789 RepID=UPI0035DCAD0F